MVLNSCIHEAEYFAEPKGGTDVYYLCSACLGEVLSDPINEVPFHVHKLEEKPNEQEK